mgnify:CR=1 FL=1
MALYLAALRRNNAGARERMRQLRMAADKFASALTTFPDSAITLYQWGLVLLEGTSLVKIHTTHYTYALAAESKLSVASGESKTLLEQACDKFKRAITIKSSFQGCYINYGEALIELAKLAPSLAGHSVEGKAKTAKHYFEKAASMYSTALSLEDFFFDIVFEKVQALYADASNNTSS